MLSVVSVLGALLTAYASVLGALLTAYASKLICYV